MSLNNSFLEPLIESLRPDLRIAFAINCAEQTLPSYERWAQNEGKGWAKPELLKDAIEFARQCQAQGSFNEDEIQKYIDEVYAITPDTEIFPDASGYGALDSACAVGEALQCLKSQGNVQDTLSVSSSALFTADSILGWGLMSDQDRAAADLKREVAFQIEAERQKAVIAFLKTLD